MGSRWLVAGAVVLAATVGNGGVAMAADASVDPTAAAPGQQVTISGDCGPAQPGNNVIAVFQQGTEVFAAVASQDLPSNGIFNMQATVPHEFENIPINPGAADWVIICDVIPPPADVILPFTVLSGVGEEPPPPTTTNPPAEQGGGSTATPPTTPPQATTPTPVVVSPRFTG